MIRHYNRLGETASPYLLQHRQNPIHWFWWDALAFEAARETDRPIFLSIGYSSCYWCHVMERESFEHDDIAALLNRDFISIKVDREEQPDVDHRYMDAVVALTGRGGWPLSVFLLPDGTPFFGGTYFPRDGLMSVLTQVSGLWRTDRARVLRAADELAHALAEMQAYSDAAGEPTGTSLVHTGVDRTLTARSAQEIWQRAYADWHHAFDPVHGGFGGAPKFPPSTTLMALLRLHRRTGDAATLAMVTHTLDAMLRGGIYDHLGGGFHRYATDAAWRVPHFEKMLYDNALLTSAYLETFQVTGATHYADAARATLDYILRDMTAPDGGFYSALDAGDMDHEGEYYVWTDAELQHALSADEYAALREVYDLPPEGNFEAGTNILYAQFSTDVAMLATPLAQHARAKLLERRARRTPPRLDDKILTAWNGLMIATCAQGFQVLGDARYLSAAVRSAHALEQQLYADGILYRRYRNGDRKFSGTLDDYTFLIHGLLALTSASSDAEWLTWATMLQRQMDQQLWDNTHGGYYFTDGADQLLRARRKIFRESAMPTGNAIALQNLQLLYHHTGDAQYRTRADSLRHVLANRLMHTPTESPAALLALEDVLDEPSSVVILGAETDATFQAMRALVGRQFLPHTICIATDPATLTTHALPLLQGKALHRGHTTAYVCSATHCYAPTNALNELEHLLRIKDPRGKPRG